MAGAPIQPYKMSKIKEKLLQPALTSHYICEFLPPGDTNSKVQKFLQDRLSAGFPGGQYKGDLQELIRLSCSDASLPGSTLMTNEINNDYTGVTERHAYRRSYDDRADFTFIVDRNYFVVDFFENWISYVAGENLLSNEEQPNRIPQTLQTYNYRVNFPHDYMTDYLYISKFEKDYGDPEIDRRNKINRPLTYQFINAYPISINSMPVSYESSQLLKCTVSFTYSRYILSRSPEQFDRDVEPLVPTPNTLAEQTIQSQQLNNGTINTRGQAGSSLPLPPTVA